MVSISEYLMQKSKIRPNSSASGKDMKKNINITIDTDLNIEFEIEHC